MARCESRTNFNLQSRSRKKLAVLRCDCIKKVANELILHLERHFLRKADRRNSNEGAIRNDATQSIFQSDDLAINDAGRNVISNSHPITDRLEPRLPFSNQTSKFQRLLALANCQHFSMLSRNPETCGRVTYFRPMGFQPVVLNRTVGHQEHYHVPASIGIAPANLLAIDLSVLGIRVYNSFWFGWRDRLNTGNQGPATELPRDRRFQI